MISRGGVAGAHPGQRRAEGEFIITKERSANEFVITRDTSWKAMLGKDEREATEEEITALEATHGPFQAADGEGKFHSVIYRSPVSSMLWAHAPTSFTRVTAPGRSSGSASSRSSYRRGTANSVNITT